MAAWSAKLEYLITTNREDDMYNDERDRLARCLEPAMQVLGIRMFWQAGIDDIAKYTTRSIGIGFVFQNDGICRGIMQQR